MNFIKGYSIRPNSSLESFEERLKYPGHNFKRELIGSLSIKYTPLRPDGQEVIMPPDFKGYLREYAYECGVKEIVTEDKYFIATYGVGDILLEK